MARANGINADEMVGRLIQKGAEDLRRFEAEQEHKRLRSKLGDDYLELLRQTQE